MRLFLNTSVFETNSSYFERIYVDTPHSDVYNKDIMKNRTIFDTPILEATIAYVAEHGLENTSVKKVAKTMHISEGSIFKYFPTKPELLVACFYHIEREIDAIFKAVPFDHNNVVQGVQDLWTAYFRYWTSHRADTLFYRQFMNSSYRTNEVDRGRRESFSYFSQLAMLHIQEFAMPPMIFWAFVVLTTLNLATCVVNGELPGDEASEKTYFSLIAGGVMPYYKPSDT